ncbi:hypothetical protein H7H73_06155 [Mycobacterium rufum]|uniref:DUF559 domain-containing protein n=1 Tax=Mycolicibacterium rufum TaxID=318424 RepID=A0A9X2YBG8_9MYCO|nr:hypothetical protein EU78_06370 [Mycolicibacterium rufum]MCV7070138.1 hypothetical protein [Mycolicibacterium rufum]
MAGGMTWGELRRRHVRLFRDVYIDSDAEVTSATLARAGWLWSGRTAIIAGRSAAALHGSAWVDTGHPVELIHQNRHRLPGLRLRGDSVDADETMLIDGMAVTTPARTALDLACWHPRAEAMVAVDALLRATGLDVAEAQMLADRHPGRRGIVSARRVLDVADAGAQSPRETWLRMLLLDDGLPPPTTQIPVYGDTGSVVAYLDMGWPDLKVAVEYDGEQHRTSRSQYRWDVRRLEIAARRGWIVVRVLAGDDPADIVRRVRAARARRMSGSRRSA